MQLLLQQRLLRMRNLLFSWSMMIYWPVRRGGRYLPSFRLGVLECIWHLSFIILEQEIIFRLQKQIWQVLGLKTVFLIVEKCIRSSEEQLQIVKYKELANCLHWDYSSNTVSKLVKKKKEYSFQTHKRKEYCFQNIREKKKQLYFCLSGSLITPFWIFFYTLSWVYIVFRSDGLIQLWTWKLTRGMTIYIFRYIEQHPFSTIIIINNFCNL